MSKYNHNSGGTNDMNFPVAFCKIDSEGELVMANNRWLKLFETETLMLPEYQPHGELTRDFIRGHMDKALSESESSFEIYANKPNESFICVAVNLQSEADGTFTAYAHDITHYKTTLGNALKREQETLEMNNILIKSAPFVLSVWDEDYNLLAASDQVVKIFELEDKQEYVDGFIKYSPKFQPCGTLSSEKAKIMLSKAFVEGKNNFEWMHQTSKGEQLPMEIVAVRFTQGGKYMIAAYATDLRPMKAVLESEKKALDLARRFLDAAPIFIETWDNEMNLTGTNQEAVKMFGLRDTDHYMEVYARLHPEYQPCGMKTVDKIPIVIEQVMKHGYTEGEWMHIDLEGNPVPVQSCYVRFDVGNDEHYIVGYSQDLRPIRAAMAKLESALKTTQDLINSAPLFIEVWDEDINIIECNDVAAKMFGIPAEEAHTRILTDLSPEFQPCGTPSVDFVRNQVALAFKEGKSHIEYMHKDAEGKPFPVDVTYVRMLRNDKNVVVGYNVDLRPNKAANEMTQEFLDAAPFFVEVWNKNYELIGCSQAAVKTFGISSKEEYINGFQKLCPTYQPCGKLSEDVIKEIVSIAFREGYARNEWTHLDKDGNLWPFDVVYVRMRRLDDDIVVAYATDLRPIKNAMNEVRKALELSQMYLDAAPFFVEIWDCNLYLKSCNEAAVKMFGLSGTHEYVKIFDELSPEYQPCGTPSDKKIKEIVQKAVEEGYYRCEWTHIGIDGQPFPVDVVYVKLNNGEEDIIVGYNQDLRPLRIAMDKLMASEERSKILLDASPTPSIIFDEAINAVDSNFAALTLFAIEPGVIPSKTYQHTSGLEECIHEQCSQFHSCGRNNCPLRLFLLENHLSIFTKPGEANDVALTEIEKHCYDVVKYGTQKYEQTLTTLYGESIPCEITIVSVNYDGSLGFAFYLRDLREEKLRAMAEDANRAKTSFLSTISHEIRTPLNAILGITEIRLMDNKIDPKIRDDFEKIYASSDVLLNIINDILDLSKIEAGKLSIMDRKYEIASLISDTIQLNIIRLGSKPIDFVLLVSEDTPTHALGDELRVKQVLSNLLSNAFKYTEEGEVTLNVRTFDLPDCDAKFVLEMRVTDTGVGMTKQQVEDLFDEFSRFYESETTPEGTGLGMSITQNLVTLMGGELKVESETGKGSTFTITLPQGKIPGCNRLGKEMVENLQEFRTIGSRMNNEQITREPMPYGKVLVVDDVDINIYVVMGLLTPYELQIDDASSGMEAVEKIRNGNEYDIIFMDHMMPEMDGIEATKLLRDLGYTKPIVALTANAVVGQSEMFLKNGFDDFISKPIDVRSMNIILNKYIRDRHPSKAHAVAQTRAMKDKITEALDESQQDSPEDTTFAEIFVRDTQKTINTINEALKKNALYTEQGLRMFTVHIHELKSALANMKSNDLSGTAQRFESLAREGRISAIMNDMPSFLLALNDLVTKMTLKRTIQR